MALGVLGHRLIVRPEAEIEGKQVADVIADLLKQVPVLETETPRPESSRGAPEGRSPRRIESRHHITRGIHHD